MSRNMNSLDRGLRALIGLAAIAVAIAIGAGSVAGIVPFAFAAVPLATSVVGFCPLYRLIRFDSRGHRPLTQ
jgi:Inner membrane protein YgaP-like, transmembrane domain